MYPSVFLLPVNSGIIQKNTQLISRVVEKNPRELKRFINNYIVAYEIHSSIKIKKVDPTHLLLVQAINTRWNNFYRLLVGSSKELREKLLNEIDIYKEMKSDKRISELESERTEAPLSIEIKRILQDFKLEEELWIFLKTQYDTISQIGDWETYRRAAESVKEILTTEEATASGGDMTLLLNRTFDSFNILNRFKRYFQEEDRASTDGLIKSFDRLIPYLEHYIMPKKSPVPEQQVQKEVRELDLQIRTIARSCQLLADRISEGNDIGQHFKQECIDTLTRLSEDLIQFRREFLNR
jgi:hypothetical protein